MTKEAAAYAQLSGILLGIAVTSLALILAISLAGEYNLGGLDEVATAFFGSILSLGITNLIATEVSSEPTNGGRAAMTSGLLGLSLSASAMSLFYALLVLLRHARMASAFKHARWVTGVGLPVFTFQLMALASEQMNVTRFKLNLPLADIVSLGYLLSTILAALLILAVLARRPFLGERWFNYLPGVTSALSLACVMVEIALLRMSPNSVPPAWMDYVLITFIFLIFAYFGLAAARLQLVDQSETPNEA